VNKLVSVAAAGLVMVLAACSSTPTDKAATSATAAQGTAGAGKSGSTDGTGQAASTVRSTALAAHLDANSALSKEHSVFFGFDEAVIGPEDARVIEQHGKYLAASPKLKVKIEGNADERGSAEYNLALGQKRAEATLKALKIWGVRDSQMEPISWGEEHPQDKGHDESAYDHNRRADIVYAKP
jgi:peptidoglycan-associated lipoprotein